MRFPFFSRVPEITLHRSCLPAADPLSRNDYAGDHLDDDAGTQSIK